jgi:elongation factor P hydroxylase
LNPVYHSVQIFDFTPNFNFYLSKIENQAHKFPCGNKVIDQLDFMGFNYSPDGFQLDNDSIIINPPLAEV